MESAGNDHNPWGWLGLLQWSLSYSDGTQPTEQTPMSEEKRAFLERVMKEGVINENERMKAILQETSEILDQWRKNQSCTTEQEERVEILLEELRDIVEQIDWARTFAALGGLPFLLGCVNERSSSIPESTKILCLAILATMCQNNPPVQEQLIELGSVRVLSDVFFDEASSELLRARSIQAVSANVRSHELAENVFCQLDQAVPMLERGLGVNATDTTLTSLVVQKRTLFFLRALVTSDIATRARVRQFESCIAWITQHFLNAEDTELRESALQLIQQLLQQRKSVNIVLQQKDIIVATAQKRIGDITQMEKDEREWAGGEVELWNSVLATIAVAEPDSEITTEELVAQ